MFLNILATFVIVWMIALVLLFLWDLKFLWIPPIVILSMMLLGTWAIRHLFG